MPLAWSQLEKHNSQLCGEPMSTGLLHF